MNQTACKHYGKIPGNGLFFCVVVVLALCGATSTLSAQPADTTPPASPYIGESSRESTDDILLGRRRFEAGARSSWHIHPGGQLLFIEEGRARVQRRGEPIRELEPGDSDFTGPNIPHWHGSAPDDASLQSSMSFGGIGPWLEPVTDEEYLGTAITQPQP